MIKSLIRKLEVQRLRGWSLWVSNVIFSLRLLCIIEQLWSNPEVMGKNPTDSNSFSFFLSVKCMIFIYYIDTDEIPGFFQWWKFRIQWRYDLYLSHVKISRLSWLLQSQPMKFIKVVCLIAIIFRIHVNATYFLYNYLMCVRSIF